jgi:hypothetical protein
MSWYCQTLHDTLGISAVKHLAPSSLDVRALRACSACLPNALFESIDYTPEEIHHLRILHAPSHP